MQAWKIGLAVALPAAVVISCILYITFYRSSHKKQNPQVPTNKPSLNHNLRHSNRVANVWRNHYSYSHRYPMQAFSWKDHPSLIAEVVEHGWVTFGFTKTYAPSSPSNFRGLYNRCPHGGGVEAEISWEMESGADCLQKIRLNPGLPSKKNLNSLLPVQSMQAALPIPGPGPSLGSLLFPQKAYFEITILAENGVGVRNLFSSESFEDNDNAKLISQPFNSEDHPQHVSSEMTPTNVKVDLEANYKEVGVAKMRSRNSSKDTHFQLSSLEPSGIPKVISLGLAVGGTALYRLPGCEPGSVGFHSTGFIFLNGMAHLDDIQEQHKPASSKRAWGDLNTVIGCGFDPANRRVFYTLNGEQVYSLICNSYEFSHPLYPTIAANYDVTVLVNFGQRQFEYLPANDQRVPNPCFRKPLQSNSVKFVSRCVYEDSSDLFSMGRIDAQWLGNLESSNSDLQHKHIHFDADSEFIEIHLDENYK
ncbi:hypothetical protein KI387_028954 [Taxus chinensis]|uniref:SPRY domain-containing protein n=1 Tax=Taxus chinensis TaxID=29808 RepID=A0AA38CBF4_TAXCH|nr:hypothetical protein KI387_028954 [Taxus chinensis]